MSLNRNLDWIFSPQNNLYAARRRPIFRFLQDPISIVVQQSLHPPSTSECLEFWLLFGWISPFVIGKQIDDTHSSGLLCHNCLDPGPGSRDGLLTPWPPNGVTISLSAPEPRPRLLLQGCRPRPGPTLGLKTSCMSRDHPQLTGCHDTGH